MIDPELQVYLLAFMVVFTMIIFFWGNYRSGKTVRLTQTNQAKIRYQKYQRAGMAFRLIFALFGIMTIVYAAIPEFYPVFVPLDGFHQPVINMLGVIILVVSLIWVISAQLHVDREYFHLKTGDPNVNAAEIFYYSERTLLKGLTLMFIGMFVTITNVVGIVLGISALIILITLRLW